MNTDETTYPVKSWTEGNIVVVSRLFDFIHLCNIGDQREYYRGFYVEPRQSFFSDEARIVSQILGIDSSRSIMPIAPSKVLPPRGEAINTPPGGRYMKLR